MSFQFDDVEIMRRIAAQDQQAFRLLYQEYGKAVFSLAYRIVQNVVLAEEITQDSFLKVWNHKNQWDPKKGKLKNWLLTITHFTAIDRLRKERRQPTLHQDTIEDMEEQFPSGNGEPPVHDGALLLMLVQQLPPEQASLIDLAFFKGMSHGEIANTTHIPLGTVKSRLRQGLQRLRVLWLESTMPTSSPR
ncbi:MAG: sigma-70 family RNA polymerase sigma factor [Anaerolineae bacterium]